jgi:uncharacterized membrane protein
MTAVTISRPAEPERTAPPRARRRLPASIPGLLALIVMAALLPARGTWAADLVLVLLSLSVPGVLALRALGVPSAAVTAYPIYIPTAAMLVLMAAGTGADLIAPHLGVARPLHGDTTALTVIGVSLVLWLLGIRRGSAARFDWPAFLGRPLLLAPLLIPLASGIGALLLTNGDGTLAARLAAGLAVAALLFCLVFSNHLGRAQVAMLLFGCALAAEWAFSLRSQEVIGFDIATELHTAQHIQAAGIWHAVHHNDPYGAMLSLTILPSILASLTGLTPLIAFKALYPVLGAMIPVSIFLVSERVMRRRFAAGAAALLIIQSYFFQLLPEVARQEIGLVFFAALVSALFDDRLPRGAQLRLVIALSVGLVVSHYSSAYLAAPAVLAALVLQAIISRFRPLPWLSLPLLCATLVIGGGAAIWYSAVTHSANNLTSLVNSIESKGLDLVPNHTGSLITSYFNGNVGKSVAGSSFEQLAVKDYRGRSGYIHPLAAAREPRYQLQPAAVPVPPVRVPALASGVRDLWTAIGQLMLIFGALGALVMTIRRRGPPLAREIGILALSMVGGLVVIRFSGTVAESYNQTRALLEALILLTMPAAWSAQALVDRVRRRRHPRWLTPALAGVTALALALVFAYQTGLTALISGGGTSLNVSQSGEDFERQYMTPAELAAASWASDQSTNQLLYADRYGQLRVALTSGRAALTDLTPETIDRDAWIYGTRTNTVLGRARGQIGSTAALYQWPSGFLNAYFNAVYANGDSRVFHR